MTTKRLVVTKRGYESALRSMTTRGGTMRLTANQRKALAEASGRTVPTEVVAPRTRVRTSVPPVRTP